MIARTLTLIAPLAMMASALAAPSLAAQDIAAEPVAQESVEGAEDDGLSGSVTDENEWQDLGIAITTFATDRDVGTQTNAGTTSALGRAVSQVISDDVMNRVLRDIALEDVRLDHER